LLNRKRWKTRIELANAIFGELGIFHNRHRRHSPLGMLRPEAGAGVRDGQTGAANKYEGLHATLSVA
jgi:transposase InsO family protein